MKTRETLKHLLLNARRLLLTTHLYPDGDAAGSVIGFAKSLRKHGVSVDIAMATEVGERFEFLYPTEVIYKPSEIRGPFDAAVILDIGSEDRTGFPEVIRELAIPLVNIDHHATNEHFGLYNIVDTEAASTCELVYRLISEFGLPLDHEVAEGLYVGLLTDSRYFQNANVSAATFMAAAALLATGLNPQPIIKRLTQSRSPLDLYVLGAGLVSFESRMNGMIAYTKLRQSDFGRFGANHRHAWSSGLFGYLISLGSAIVAVSFVESETGVVFCEFRSKEGFDVSEIASHFGGGGHRSASGCSRNMPIDACADEVIGYLEKHVSRTIQSSR